MNLETAEFLLRIACAALAGTAVGTERELRGHPAGLRTHALVSIGAAAFTVAGFVDWGSGSGTADPTRLAAQVVSGIGFIGAGAILRDGTGVKGLTTATTIWVSGALGVAFGTGSYFLAAGATAIVLAVLTLFRRLNATLNKHGRSTATLDVEYEIGHGTIGPIVRSIQDLDARIEWLTIEDTPQTEGADLRRVQLEIASRHSLGELFEIVAEPLQAQPEVRSINLRPTVK